MSITKQHVQRQRGFTLIELMVSLAIFATISTLSFMSLIRIQQAQATTDKEMSRLTELQRAMRRMGQDILYASSRGARDNNGKPIPAFSGKRFPEVYLQLTRSGVDSLINGNPSNQQRIGYLFEKNTLYRLVWQQLDQAPDSKPEKYPILTKVSAMQINYLDRSKTNHKNWPVNAAKANEEPIALEIIVTTKDLGKFRRLFYIRDPN